MGKVAIQTEVLMVNVNQSCKSRGYGTKDECLTSGGPTHIPKGMVEKGLERESEAVLSVEFFDAQNSVGCFKISDFLFLIMKSSDGEEIDSPWDTYIRLNDKAFDE